ncbi:MAG: ABC transporter permease subunit [Clostridium sp.]|jgi:putative aldouronate transport system permease protein|nr:ABC transporter permease subunit [Clostridium sp.]
MTGISVKKSKANIQPLSKRIIKYKALIIMMLPAISFFAVFCYAPMYGVVLAFKDYSISKGIMASDWVGLYYFKRLFSSSRFWEVMQNTLVISLLKLIIGFFPPVIFALFLNEVQTKWFKKLTQTASYLPYFISWIVMAGIVREIFSANGVINQIITSFGGEAQIWLSKKAYFRTILVSTDIWKGFGWGSIIYISAISSIDPQLYEAASLDGAGRLKKILHITLPCLIPVITINMILAMGGVLNAGFDQIFNLTNSSVKGVADIIDTYVYELGIQNRDYSLSTAVGLFKSLIAMILVLSTNFIAKRINGAEYTLW